MRTTHQDLVQAGAQWLRQSCSVVYTELDAGIGEIPDVIGWDRNCVSTVIECKVSRSDFQADSRKQRRLGCKRYYLSPVGLLKERNVTDNSGLLVHCRDGVRLERESWQFGTDQHAEIRLLVKALGCVDLARMLNERTDRLAGVRKRCDENRDARLSAVDDWRARCQAAIDEMRSAAAKVIIRSAGQHPYKSDSVARGKLYDAIRTGHIRAVIDERQCPYLIRTRVVHPDVCGSIGVRR